MKSNDFHQRNEAHARSSTNCGRRRSETTALPKLRRVRAVVCRHQAEADRQGESKRALVPELLGARENQTPPGEDRGAAGDMSTGENIVILCFVLIALIWIWKTA